MSTAEFSIYIIRCKDGTYYTGIATDVTRRMTEHESSARGAKYLKGRGPLTLVFSATAGDRSTASQIEYLVKRLDRAGKEALIDGSTSLPIVDQGSEAG